MNIFQEKRRALGVHRLHKGGSKTSSSSDNSTSNFSSSSSVNTTETTNNDRRLVLQDSMAIGDHSAYSSSAWSDNDTQTTIYSTVQAADAAVLGTFANSLPDAVRALGNAGADVIKNAGGAVVDLNRDSINANTKAWDSTLDHGAAFVDRSIDLLAESFGIAQESIGKAYGTANAAVAAFTPTENKNADIGKYAMLAAAAVCALVLLNKD